jgi:small-conductance mechanosensitive channel
VRAHLNAALLGVWLTAGCGAIVFAQPAPAASQPPAAGSVQPPALPSSPAAVTVEPSAQAATLVFFNRPIVTLRATVLGRRPSDRTAAAVKALDEVVDSGVISPIEVSPFEGGVLVRVGPRAVFGLTALDVDQLSGESLDGVAQQSVTHLRQALDEAREAHAPIALFRGAAVATLAVLLGFGLLWIIVRVRSAVLGRLRAVAVRTVARSGLADVDMLRASRLLEIQHGVATTVFVGLGLIVTYVTATFVLRQFPFTRPWGESMNDLLLLSAEHLGASALNAIPGLFTVGLIVVIARVVARLIRAWFDAVERGRVQARLIHPETAQPTRRLLTALVWLFAIVMAYPYLPGSQSEAFKGMSVFLGLMVTFGSTGLVNQIMGGFMITYSRALRLGDFVRIGEVEGTVIHLGVLSTKIKTVFNEEVTVPNAVVVGQTITDYTRIGETEGVLTPTSVTIGYDAPWRQVHAMLLQAAERTPGLRREPAPAVVQASLDDFYVKYTLLVSLERQETRLRTFDALNANIQDIFNEHSVQIMSPNYVLDPAAPKVVAKKDWFAAPARNPNLELRTENLELRTEKR